MDAIISAVSKFVSEYERPNNTWRPIFDFTSSSYSGTSEQRPPSGTSLLASVEMLALVGRFV